VYLLAVDPGLRACGCAVFSDGVLIAAGLPAGAARASLTEKLKGTADPNALDMHRPDERAEVFVSMARAVRAWAAPYGTISELAIEMPRIYPRGSQREEKRGTDPNDLLHLTAVVGAICAAFASAETTVYLPSEWKHGNISKEIQHPRVLARLAPAELATIPKLAASRLHNVMDGVAIGLSHLARL
jgi:hypothetical protein